MIKLSYVDFVLYLSISSLMVFGLNLALIPNNTTVGAILKRVLPINIMNGSSSGTTITTANVAATQLTDKSSVAQMATASLGAPNNKTFYLFNADTGSNKNQTQIPPDTFAPNTITVNKGDTVNIVYYNTEPVKDGDPHTFTIGAPYDINVNVNPQQHSTIHFKANTAGAFQFYCSVHLPTMRGELVVLP
jgi:plastocyanin